MENFKRKIEDNEISQENLAMMYLTGIIEINVLIKFVNRNIDWVEVINTLPEVDKIEKLGELYLNKLQYRHSWRYFYAQNAQKIRI